MAIGKCPAGNAPNFFFQNQHIFWFKGVIETDIFQNWILAGDLAQGKWSSTSMKSL